MRLFINALSASAGGGLTYIWNVLPHLAALRELQLVAAVTPGIHREFQPLAGVKFLELSASPGRRFWYEQVQLPRIICEMRADVLLSTGNFALKRSPVPQILLSRNSIYTSEDFRRDLISRWEFRMWLDTTVRGTLARRSVQWADVTVAPSEAFAAELRRWTGASNIVAIHHGFDPERFTADQAPLPSEVEDKIRGSAGVLKLLFVSHYNYYRNFETLIRALPLIRDRLAGRAARLFLTCKLAAGENPGTYRAEEAAKLIRELGVGDMVVELGAVQYGQLHQLYRRADIYVSPAYTETFAHPLVEAMYCGLPVVASDLEVHREVCGDAALYFPRFSPGDLADRVAKLAASPALANELSAKARTRPDLFSWELHATKLLTLANALLTRPKPHGPE